MSNPTRSLRLGVVYRGSIIHEEMIDRQIDISVGRRAGSTIHIPPKSHPDFPEYMEFLAFDQGRHFLVVPADPSARVSLRGAAASEPITVKGKRVLPLEAVAGGSVTQGDVTVMFQFVRADTHPTVTHERNVLRLGLVFDERLIDDRIHPDVKQVTIGNTRDCGIVLPSEDYQGPPLTFVNHKDGTVTMRAPAAMKVRVAVDEQPLELKDLQAKGRARQEGNDMVCHLSLGTRGRAIMGSHTVLFQVVKQSVTVPMLVKKTLPQKVVSGVLNEPAWWISFAVSLLFIGGLAIQAHFFQKNTAIFLKQKAEEQANAEHVYVVDVPVKEEIKEPEKEEEAKPDDKPVAAPIAPAEKAKPDKTKDTPKADAKAEDKPRAAGETVDPETAKRNQRAAADEAIKAKTIAGAFGGAGAATKMFGEAAEGEEGQVIAKTFGGTGEGAGEGEGKGPGSGVKLGGNAGGGTVRKVDAGSKGGFGDRKADATKDAGAKKEEAAVKINFNAGSVDGPGENKAEVAKVVARKNSAVQRCYEEALRDNPDEAGKVKVTFTVGTEGTVTDVSVSGASGKFAECIKSKFSAIRGLPTLPSPQTFSQSYVFSKGS